MIVFRRNSPATREDIHEAAIEAGARRVHPCLMTTATTILALIPVPVIKRPWLGHHGPDGYTILGGMAVQVLSLLVVPVLYVMVKELGLKFNRSKSDGE